jgi:hypothetical protein
MRESSVSASDQIFASTPSEPIRPPNGSQVTLRRRFEALP